MKRMLIVAIVLACSVEVKAQSIEGWSAVGASDGFSGRDGFVRAWDFAGRYPKRCRKALRQRMLTLGWSWSPSRAEPDELALAYIKQRWGY